MALSASRLRGYLSAMSRGACGVPVGSPRGYRECLRARFAHVLSTPIALSPLPSSLLHLPGAVLSTPMALSASLLGGDLSAMSRGACGVPAGGPRGYRECLCAHFAHVLSTAITLSPLPSSLLHLPRAVHSCFSLFAIVIYGFVIVCYCFVNCFSLCFSFELLFAIANYCFSLFAIVLFIVLYCFFVYKTC